MFHAPGSATGAPTHAVSFGLLRGRYDFARTSEEYNSEASIPVPIYFVSILIASPKSANDWPTTLVEGPSPRHHPLSGMSQRRARDRKLASIVAPAVARGACSSPPLLAPIPSPRHRASTSESIRSSAASSSNASPTVPALRPESTYFEGRWPAGQARLLARRQTRQTQIVFGLLCNREGCPVAVEVFEGNTADPRTVGAQIDKLRRRFALERVVLVARPRDAHRSAHP